MIIYIYTYIYICTYIGVFLHYIYNWDCNGDLLTPWPKFSYRFIHRAGLHSRSRCLRARRARSCHGVWTGGVMAPWEKWVWVKIRYPKIMDG